MMESIEVNVFQAEATAEALDGKEFNRLNKQKDQGTTAWWSTQRDGFREEVRAPIRQVVPGHSTVT